jgi:DNA-binding transcriptional MerR regulator
MTVMQYSTSKFAKRFGVHPNTVRLYETWGYLPPIPRDSRGYRVFNQQHIAQMELARTTLRMPAAGQAIKDSLKEVVWLASSGEHDLAMAHVHKHLRMIEVAQTQSKAALQFAQQDLSDSAKLFHELVLPLNIRKAAELMGISVPVLRRWEYYGLIVVPQNDHNHYREYGAVEIGWLHVIHTLRLVGHKIEGCACLLKVHDELLEALKFCYKILGQHQVHILKVRRCLEQMPMVETSF